MNETTSHQPDSRRTPREISSNWERETLEKLMFATLKEQRAARRWHIFFRLLMIGIAVVGLWIFFDLNFPGDDAEALGRHTALIEIEGNIEEEGSGAADNVVPSLNKAFSDNGSVAVVLRINSPGGSPVQAGIIVDEIKRLRRGYPTKQLYVVVDEMCASGGYYIAAAADRIFVNKASIVGSVGVLMDGFGFTGTMEKLGVERRLMTAGENKGFLDPFSPQSEKHKAHAQAMLNEIHQQFISVVRAGRGKRLKETPDTFSGLYWSGAKAVEMGLADGFGTVDSVARDIVKVEDIVDYTAHEGLPERVLKKFGAAVGEGAVKAMGPGNLPQLR
ncbi:S49 family peptidase [Massilia sp. GCM10020059]|uniref:S49 family peptidase n=1 Tax=Massilia agrisoli TaxID=2892444 RepID=A0ABS8IRK5_9BURK|nr:S49 family peptidase [Massilia agrisoli]MCC6071272.1 S49 family peptidase [Massilia agrisoli]